MQAEVTLYQSTRAPKGTFVEFTSRISNRLREMESGFKECLPPKVKGFNHQATSETDTRAGKALALLHANEGARVGQDGGRFDPSRPD